MNATTLFFNAVKSVQKPAAIGLLTIIGLGIVSTFAIVILTLLTFMIPILLTVTKAASYGYFLFITGLFAINLKQQSHKKEPPTIAILPIGKLSKKHNNQEKIINKTLITPLAIESIYNLYIAPKQPSWKQQILNQIQPITEIQDASQLESIALVSPGLDTALRRDVEPLNNQFALTSICWQALAKTSKLLDRIKASELKSIASDLQIPKYRQMKKSQLLLEIIRALDEAPEFSE